jgi:hypothetical protein
MTVRGSRHFRLFVAERRVNSYAVMIASPRGRERVVDANHVATRRYAWLSWEFDLR